MNQLRRDFCENSLLSLLTNHSFTRDQNNIMIIGLLSNLPTEDEQYAIFSRMYDPHKTAQDEVAHKVRILFAEFEKNKSKCSAKYRVDAMFLLWTHADGIPKWKIPKHCTIVRLPDSPPLPPKYTGKSVEIASLEDVIPYILKLCVEEYDEHQRNIRDFLGIS